MASAILRARAPALARTLLRPRLGRAAAPVLLRARSTVAEQPRAAGAVGSASSLPGTDLPEFTVGPSNGFLPRREPMIELPSQVRRRCRLPLRGVRGKLTTALPVFATA